MLTFNAPLIGGNERNSTMDHSAYLHDTEEVRNYKEIKVKNSLKSHKCRFCGKVIPSGTPHVVAKQFVDKWYTPRFCNQTCCDKMNAELQKMANVIELYMADLAHGDNTCYVQHF